MSSKTYSRLTLATVLAVVAWYAVGFAAWTTMGNVAGGDVLTSTGWNALLGNVSHLNSKFGTLTAGKECTSDGTKIDCTSTPDTARQAVVMTDTATYSFTTSWKIWPVFPTSPTFKAGSKVKLSYHMPLRNDSTGWGGAYVEPQVSFDGGTTWNSLGSSWFDGGIMNNWSADIGSYFNSILIDPVQASDYTVKVRFYFKSYDGTASLNGDHNINTISGNATLMSWTNGTQHYAKIILEEIR